MTDIREETARRMMTALIQIDNLVKYYQMGDFTVHALRGLSMTIERGSFVAIMGPSGSGKSTFMNIVGCLDKPTSGRYLLDGLEVSNLSLNELAEARNSKIGFVFQQFNLLRRTSALENVELPLLYSDAPRASRRQRAMQALETVGLADRGHHHPSQLSGGQQQRVAIARSLINNPQIILADEPTGALDTRTSVEIMALFQDLNRSGITIILVTHENDIAQYANRSVQFKDGHLVRDEALPVPWDARAKLAEMPEIED
jgi:putative ABC transport system ATP-binding protein